MILYHVITTYHLLNALLLHLSFEKEEGTLLIPSWFAQKFSHMDLLYKVFNKIVTIDIQYRFSHSKNETQNYFKSYVGDIKGFSEIYVWGAQYSFGIMLAEQKIPFVFCEEGAGLLSRPSILENIDSELKKDYLDYIKNLGLFSGNIPYVNRVFCNQKAQIENFYTEKQVINFDVIKELGKLTCNKRQEIMNFFVGKEIKLSIPCNSVLFLTQHFANLKVLSFEEQVEIYQIVIDYFFPNQKIIFKTHPDDLMYYSRLFPEAQVIRDRFPSEFLPFIVQNTPSCIATISSTAIFNLRGNYSNIFELDGWYEKNFRMTHRYYVALIIARTLRQKVFSINTNDILIKRLSKVIGVNVQQNDFYNIDTMRDPYVLLIDDIIIQNKKSRERIRHILQNLHKDSCVFFLNSKEDFCWYDYGCRVLWEKIVPIILQKTVLPPLKEDFYISTDEETIYAYSLNKELLAMVKEKEIKKVLPHAGVEINTCTLTAEQERIKILEGILAATEKRLIYYIEKERSEK